MSRLQNAVQQLKSKNQPILDNTDRALGLLPLMKLNYGALCRKLFVSYAKSSRKTTRNLYQ